MSIDNKKSTNQDEIIGLGEGLVNQNSEEFKTLQSMIKNQSMQLSQANIIEIPI